MLICGLGFGFTLAETLARVGPSASVTVVEVAPAVIRWNREQLGELNGRALDDPRVTLVEADVCSAAPVPMTRRVFRAGRAAISLRGAAQRGPRKEAKIHDRLCDVGDE